MRTYGLTVGLSFSALAVLQTWPIAAYARTRVIDAHDAVINAWLLTAAARQIVAHPLHWFDINMYYPYRAALASLDHQFSNLAIVAPITLATGNPLLAANLFVIASFVLAGTFTAILVRHLTGSSVAGLVAGCVFAFSPARLENAPQTHVLGGFWMPLTFYAVHLYMRQPSWSHLALAVTSYVLLALASWYYAIIGAIGLVIVAGAELAASGVSRGPVLRRAVVGAVPVLLLLGAIARPYATIAQQFVPWLPHAADVHTSDTTGEESAPAIDRTMKPHVMQALSAPVESYAGVAAATRMPWTPRLRRYGQVGARFFPGVAAALLAAIALVRVTRAQLKASRLAWITVVFTAIAALAVLSAAIGWRGSPFIGLTRAPGFFALLLASFAVWLIVPRADTGATARTYVVLAAIGALLSFGEHVTAFTVTIGTGVYPATLAPFSLLRAPARMGMLYAMALAVLAGFGYAAVSGRIRRAGTRAVLAIATVAAVNIETLAVPIEMPRVGRPPEAYTWLKTAPDGPVIEFPIHNNGWALYWSLFHDHPASNGYGLVEPAAYYRLEEPDDLSPDMLEHARAYFHPRYVIVNRDLYEPVRLRALDENLARAGDILKPVARFGPRMIFEVTGPSRGTLVLRSYPAWMVRGKRRIAVHATVDPLPLGGPPVVQVWGNGQLLASSVGRGAAIVAPLPAGTGGGLDVEVMADYTLPAGSGAAIGRTGRIAPADIALEVDPERTRIQINGHVWIGRKGYTLVTLEPDGRVRDARAFNTSWSEAQSQALAAFIRALEPGRIVAVATTFDASRSLTADAVSALRTLGIATDLRGRFGWAHAAVGVAGAAAGTAAESAGESTASFTIGSPATIPISVHEVRIH